MPRKDSYIEFKNNLNIFISKRHKSLGERTGGLISLFRRPSKETIIFDKKNQLSNREQPNINETKNFNKKSFKRTNTMFNKDLKELSFKFDNDKSARSRLNSFDIKNIEEDENEEDNFDDYEKKKKFIKCDGRKYFIICE
jgi:hypothetical protein